MKAPLFKYHRAHSAAEALGLVSEADGFARFLAGGQSLLPMMNLRLAAPELLVDISSVPALRTSEERADGLLIGSATTHAMIEDGLIPSVTQGYLEYVAAGIAYRSIRNKGTIGGSLAHADPAADWPSALMALEAKAIVQNASGEQRYSLTDFHTGLMSTVLDDGGILVGIEVPRLSSRAKWVYLKFCQKQGEFSHSTAAIVADPALKLWQVVLGSAADRPVCLKGTAQALAAGLTVTDLETDAFKSILLADLGTVLQGHEDPYEFHLHQTMVQRALKRMLTS